MEEKVWVRPSMPAYDALASNVIPERTVYSKDAAEVAVIAPAAGGA